MTEKAANGIRDFQTVIASAAKQSMAPANLPMDCFVAIAPLRKRFAFVAGNDIATKPETAHGRTP